MTDPFEGLPRGHFGCILAIIAPKREHSRKPDGVHERIERLVAGPRLELFARQRRDGWTVWGNDLDRFPAVKSKEWTDMWSHPFEYAPGEK